MIKFLLIIWKLSDYLLTYFTQVMETKESVSTELDPNVPVEDVVTALNDSTVGPDVFSKEKSPEK